MKMTSFNKFLLLTGLTTSIVACGSDVNSIALDAPETQTIAALTIGNADEWLNEATSKRRFIGVKPSGYEMPCPFAGGPFETYQLFVDERQSTDNGFGWALGNFCVYESTQDVDVSRNTDGTYNLPFELERLKCSDTAANPTTITSPNDLNCLVKATPDRFAVGGHSAPNPKGMLAAVMAPHFEEELLTHGGYLDAFPESDWGFNTRLAFLDTSRTEISPTMHASYRRWSKRNSEHGLMMTRIGEKFACAEGGCRADITSRLAMPYRVDIAYERDTRGDYILDSYGNKKPITDTAGNHVYTLVKDSDKGGHIGTISTLAQAVQGEVAEWNFVKQQTGNDRQRLVINMSLAWMPEYGGMMPEGFNDMSEIDREQARMDWPADVQAAYVAIRNARCQGALLVAAAGNASGGQNDSGLLLPAAWVEVNAPSQAECDLHQAGSLEAGMDLLTARNHYNSGKFPLVVAASGLTREGADITNQRAGSRVEYATYADHASLQDFREPYASYFAGADNPIHIKPHTGTSVSSALLSTIAAATWSYDPELDVNLLMNAIYRTGEIVFDSAGNKVRAEFCYGKGSACTKVTKRLSMCQAIYGFDANRDGISDITGVDARTAVATHCEAWSAQLAVTPDTGAIAIPTTATSGAAPASSYETASVSQTHVYWSHAYTEGACDAGSQRLYPWSKTTGVWKKAKHYCPEQQFFTATAAPWTVPQPEGGGSDCGGACALFPSYNMLALSSSTDLALVSSPTLTVTTTAGTTSQYSLSGLSGTNTMLNFGGLSTMSIKSAKFSGNTGSYSFSSPLYLGY